MEEGRKEVIEEKGKEGVSELVRENWLSILLGGLGMVLVIAGVILLVRGGSSQPNEEVRIEEEADEKGEVAVDIQGAVLKPGVYKLSPGSRVVDLLIAAGGLSKEADRDWVAKALNQAEKLKDGEKIYIPRKGEVKGGQSLLRAKININTASLSELDTLPQIGLARAQKIIDSRPYSRIEELLEKEILPSSVFEKIKDKISVY